MKQVLLLGHHLAKAWLIPLLLLGECGLTFDNNYGYGRVDSTWAVQYDFWLN